MSQTKSSAHPASTGIHSNMFIKYLHTLACARYIAICLTEINLSHSEVTVLSNTWFWFCPFIFSLIFPDLNEKIIVQFFFSFVSFPLELKFSYWDNVCAFLHSELLAEKQSNLVICLPWAREIEREIENEGDR